MNVGTIAAETENEKQGRDTVVMETRDCSATFSYRRRIFMMSGLALKVAQSRGDIPVES